LLRDDSMPEAEVRGLIIGMCRYLTSSLSEVLTANPYGNATREPTNSDLRRAQIREFFVDL
jgi:hypothetical protein